MRGHRAHVALTLIAAAIVASGGTAPVRAQTAVSPYIEPNPNVTVDLSVLDGYGGAPNVADMLRPGYRPPAGAPAGYGLQGAPSAGGGSIPSFLVRPDGPRYAAPPPEVQALIQGQRGAVRAPAGATARPAPATASAPTLTPPQPRTAAPQPTPPAPRATTTAAATPPPPPPAPTPPPSATNTAALAAPPPPPSVPPAASTASAPPPPAPTPPSQQETRLASAPTAPPVAPTAQPSQQGAGGDLTRIAFPAGQSQLPPDAAGQLDGVISRLKQDGTLRVQLMAYADGDQDGANKARRLSLSRALAVRAYLIDNEVASTRMDVRALGNRSDDGPADRVDIVVIDR